MLSDEEASVVHQGIQAGGRAVHGARGVQITSVACAMRTTNPSLQTSHPPFPHASLVHPPNPPHARRNDESSNTAHLSLASRNHT